MLVFSLALSAAFPPVGLGADKKNDPQIDPKAAEVLHRFSDYMGKAKNFRVKATMDWRFGRGDHKGRVGDEEGREHRGSKYRIALERPNRFAMILKRGEVGATVVSNGEQMFTYIPHRESYTLGDAPSDFGPIIDVLTMTEGVTNMVGFVFVRALLDQDPYAVLTSGFAKGEYLGTDKVDGSPCDHVKLTEGELTFEFWIKSGKKPLVMRFQVGLPRDQARIGDERYDPHGSERISIRVAFRDWKIDGKMRGRDFKFKVPRKAQEVASAKELEFAYPPHPLLGKKAPKFKTDLLNGEEFKLSRHKGKHIVVLDFWATWCVPCRMALPGLIEVTSALADRGVRFYAVNQREEKDVITSFLKQQKLDFTVAMDAKGKIADKYHVQGIPQTVIIGKDGTVQAVHRGFSPDLKEQLAKELETLLSGEKLAKAGR
ncbi:MAG: DUF2092 domain-containing protein [Planctomycetes bacterium]|nr:DUF2092 domain-containing protein [Planctomycetota bacterium]